VRFLLAPPPLHPCPWKIHFWPLSQKNPSGAYVRGTCSSTEVLKGYMARGSLGTPALEQAAINDLYP